jgi:hypothetical protein
VIEHQRVQLGLDAALYEHADAAVVNAIARVTVATFVWSSVCLRRSNGSWRSTICRPSPPRWSPWAREAGRRATLNLSTACQIALKYLRKSQLTVG